MGLAAWRITEGQPARLVFGDVGLEKHLENWIEADPSMIDAGLLVLRRQMHVEGGILDLLCVDLQGRLTVVEIKRGKLIRETIAQAIDYAASIAAMSLETLREQALKQVAVSKEHPGLTALLSDEMTDVEVAVVVVGVGQEPGLERMIDFLGSRYALPIRAVTFDVFDTGDGTRVLVREETEPEIVSAVAPASQYSVESVVELAGGPNSPNGQRLRRVAEAAESSGLYVRPYKYSLMFTPTTKKTRHLITVWKWSDKDALAIEYSASAIAEFFPISAALVQEVMGLPEGRHSIATDADAAAWAERIRAVFRTVGSDGGSAPMSIGAA